MRIDRRLLFKELGFTGEKIPADYSGRHENITCRSRWPEGIVCTATVVVRPSAHKQRSDGRFVKTSKHRVIIICPLCSKEIPFGRLHQHTGTRNCVP
jgi:hypothetical protein